MGDEAAERELARCFHRHVLGDVEHVKRGGYNPTYFLGMVRDRGSAVAVAKLLLSSTRQTTYGFERLWEMGELARSIVAKAAANPPDWAPR
jgi:hypothetical protein